MLTKNLDNITPVDAYNAPHQFSFSVVNTDSALLVIGVSIKKTGGIAIGLVTIYSEDNTYKL